MKDSCEDNDISIIKTEQTSTIQQDLLILRFKCLKCLKTYSSNSQYNIHKFIHKCEERQWYQQAAPEMFVCNICRIEFSTLELILTHIETHKETCKYCNDIFANGFILGLHLAEHDEENKICCPYCKYKTKLINCLRSHIFTTHFRMKIFRCEICGTTYSSKVHLEEHIRFHHKKMNPYQCVVCQRTFIFRSSLLKHQINNHRPLVDGDVPSNFCILCKRTLSTVQALQRHINEKHTKNKPKSGERFICEICGKDFSHRQSWLLHIKGHSGLKPYKCKLCSKAFKAQALLTVHEKIHSDDRPFACECCGICFKRKEGLRRHKLIHTDIKPHVCMNCTKRFRRREHLRLHLNSCIKNVK